MRSQRQSWELLRVALLGLGLLGNLAVGAVFHLGSLERGQIAVVFLGVLVWVDAWMYRRNKPWLRFGAAAILSVLVVHLIFQ